MPQLFDISVRNYQNLRGSDPQCPAVELDRGPVRRIDGALLYSLEPNTPAVIDIRSARLPQLIKHVGLPPVLGDEHKAAGRREAMGHASIAAVKDAGDLGRCAGRQQGY